MNYANHILKNIKYSLLNYIVVNGFKFLTRIVFIKTLPIEYLGITGLFSNIFVMLSLAELGVGPAMVYALYKPLAYDDKETVNSIMLLFKKLYLTSVAVAVNKDVVTSLDLKPNQVFLVNKYKMQCRYFKQNELIGILKDLCDLDYKYKNGLIDLQIGLEAILCNYC